MPTPAQWGLLGGLLVVAVIHTRSRIAGAVAAFAWVAAGLFWVADQFQAQHAVRFLGIDVPPWVFYGFFGGLLAFNLTVLGRAFRRRRAARAG